MDIALCVEPHSLYSKTDKKGSKSHGEEDVRGVVIQFFKNFQTYGGFRSLIGPSRKARRTCVTWINFSNLWKVLEAFSWKQDRSLKF